MIQVKVDIDLKKAFGDAIKKTDIASTSLKAAVVALQAATPVDTGKARAGWQFSGTQIRNDVEYINYLNEGSSKQAPSRFVERTLLSQPGIRPNGLIVKKL